MFGWAALEVGWGYVVGVGVSIRFFIILIFIYILFLSMLLPRVLSKTVARILGSVVLHKYGSQDLQSKATSTAHQQYSKLPNPIITTNSLHGMEDQETRKNLTSSGFATLRRILIIDMVSKLN